MSEVTVPAEDSFTSDCLGQALAGQCRSDVEASCIPTWLDSVVSSPFIFFIILKSFPPFFQIHPPESRTNIAQSLKLQGGAPVSWFIDPFTRVLITIEPTLRLVVSTHEPSKT